MDARLAPAADLDSVDLSIYGSDLEHDDGVSTAVLISLFSDARAPAAPDTPILEQQLRGWWAEDENDPYGSRLWTLARAKQTKETLAQALEYARASLQWMIDDQVASAVDVQTSYVGPGILGIDVQVTRGTSRRWAELWRGMEEPFASSVDLGRVVLQLALA